MAHAARARQLRDDFEAATGVRLAYPNSREALQGFRETLDRYNAAMAKLKANNARRQGATNLVDELAHLHKIEADDFASTRERVPGSLKGKLDGSYGGPRPNIDVRARPTSFSS